MTGDWELRLQRLAEGGVPWDVPTRSELHSGLTALKQVLDRVASDPGLVGRAGASAQAAFSATASEVSKQIGWVADALPGYLADANAVRENARNSLASLPAGEMSPGQETAVRAVAIGSTFMLGPVAFLAGEGAAGAVNSYLASRREEAARAQFEARSDELDAVTVAEPPVFNPTQTPDDEDPVPPSGSNSGPGGGRSGGRSFEQYPDWNVSPLGPNGGGDVPSPTPGEPPIGGVTPPGVTPPGTSPGPGDYGPFPDGVPGRPPGGTPPIDLEQIPPTPTPDGPISGSPTLPGGIPSAPGGGGLIGGGGVVGGPGAGIGSGLAAGLVAGGGGALALGRVGAPAGGPGGSLFGRPAAGATGGAGASGRGGGLLGTTGGGTGTRGVGGLGGVAGGGASGSSAARGAGARGIAGAGMRGTGAAGSPGAAGGTAAAGSRRGAGATAGSGNGARGAGGGSRGVGGMGGAGSRSDRKDEAARALGGPIAPRMEDDEQIGPRSQNAQAGGRDTSDRSGDDV